GAMTRRAETPRFPVSPHRSGPGPVLSSGEGRGGTTMTLRTTGDYPRSCARPGVLGLLLASLASPLGCAAAPPPRAPDAAEGVSSEQLGAPYDTHYEADIEATRGRVRVIVR